MSDTSRVVADLIAEAEQLEARARQLREAARLIGVPLTSEITYDTNNSMSSSALAVMGPSRGPVPDADGPATKLMAELGYLNLAQLAKALGEKHGTVRSWNLRDDLPDRVLATVEKLRTKQSKKRVDRGK